jgi:SAM-dependent methyltransferase
MNARPAAAASFTPEELQNIATFATESSRRQYRTYGLTPRESALIERFFPRRDAVLIDIGCGYGRTTVPLHERGFEPIGLDVTSRMIEDARLTHPALRWLLASATDLPFRDASVDYALFSANGIDCISPVERRERALAEIHRVLRPGGCLIYSAHNWAAMLVTAAWNKGRRADLWRNLRARRPGPGYLTIAQPEGALHLYYGLPRLERQGLRRAGFGSVQVFPGKLAPRFERWPAAARALLDVWPYYIAFR